METYQTILNGVMVAISGIIMLISIGIWFTIPNKNNRRDLLLVSIGTLAIVTMQYGYYLTGDHPYDRADGNTAYWEYPLFTSLEGMLLVLAMSIYLALDLNIIILCLVKAAIIGWCFGSGIISSAINGNQGAHSYWFLWAGFLTICLYIISAKEMKRSKDSLGYAALAYTAVFVVMIYVGWFLGPEYMNIPSNSRTVEFVL